MDWATLQNALANVMLGEVKGLTLLQAEQMAKHMRSAIRSINAARDVEFANEEVETHDTTFEEHILAALK